MPIYLGLMSGTSADGIDAVLVELERDRIQRQIGHSHTPFTKAQKHAITALYTPQNNEIDRLGALDQQLGESFATASLELLESSGLSPDEVSAIGCHGQTVRHRPRLNTPFTLQIGDPNVIAARTGITTVADFRRRDIALGGQGAPLAPAFHHAIFGQQHPNCGVLNLGGIANITIIVNGELEIGFDIGPANGLMDYWIEKNLGKPFDAGGTWAASGQPDQELLKILLAHPFFSLQAPRSTGREEFSGTWLEHILSSYRALPAVDVQATLLEFSAQCVSRELARWPLERVFVCGGGVKNEALMQRLSQGCGHCSWQSTAALGLEPELVEATAFAWLAHMTLNKLNGNHPTVTGARRATILGALYWP